MEKLPDTKMVRTKFVVNFMAIGLLCVLVVVVGYREFSKLEINRQIASLKREQENRVSGNRIFTRFDGEFKSLADKVKDIKDFKKQPVHPAHLLVELSRMRTADVVFDAISYENIWNRGDKKELYQVQLNGKGRTTADISELKNRLRILEVQDGYEVRIDEQGNPTKDPETGVFSFIIALTISEVEE
ncbi:MAG: hypothetical protein MI748_11300 [Opitutales bacterium]|nr:hypothetical protein [Opitutales bacterium]